MTIDLYSMSNHTYRYQQETRLQEDGGSIGNLLTGEMADAIMAWWKGQFMELAKDATTHLMDTFILDCSLYVDDDSLFYEFLPPGCRWDLEQKKMVVNPDLIEGDLQEKEDVRTMTEISKMADSICPALKTTFDCPGLQESGKVPVLDLQQWVDWVVREDEDGGDWQVLWEFYRKPCSARTVMLARSAMPERTKRSTLTQEAIRILRNTSPAIPWERKAELLSDFSLRLKLSGYGERYRLTIIQSTLAAWERLVELDRTRERPLYRERGWKKDERRREKEKKKSKWFKKLGGTTNDFTIFCPNSPGGRLAAKWRRVIEDVRESSSGL